MKEKAVFSDFCYKAFLVYYLLLQFFINEAKWGKYSLLYFALVLPVLLYIGLNIPFLLKFFFNRKSLNLILLLLIGISISILRLDISSIYNLVIVILTIVIIIESKIRLSVSFVNKLFLIAILLSIISFYIGLSRFGFIPYLHDPIGLEPPWKISIFPTTPSSGYFALLVIVINYYYNKKLSKYFFYFLGSYFLIFSGIRSAILLFALFLIFNWFTKLVTFRPRMFYLLLNTLMFLGFLFIVNFNIASTLRQLNSPFVNSLILKSSFDESKKAVKEETNYRVWLWGQHFDIFFRNPIAGVGNYSLNEYVKKDLYGRTKFEGSESFFTLWLARLGVCFLLFVAFVYDIQREGLRTRNRYLYNLSLFLLVIMLSYGSFLMPYNFIYILLFGSLKLNSNQ